MDRSNARGNTSADKVRDSYRRKKNAFRYPSPENAAQDKHARLVIRRKDPVPKSKVKSGNEKYPSGNTTTCISLDCRVSYERITGWEWKND